LINPVSAHEEYVDGASVVGGAGHTGAMCGRYASYRSDADIVEAFGVDRIDGEPPGPSWNVAPTQPVRVVRDRDEAGTEEVSESAARVRELRTAQGAWCRPGPKTPRSAPR
jgi:hypothetical protein